MTSTKPFIMFSDKNLGKGHEAIELYTKSFPRSGVLDLQHYPAKEDTQARKLIMQAHLMLAGQEFYLHESPIDHGVSPNQSTSFFIDYLLPAELERSYLSLKEHGAKDLLALGQYEFSPLYAWVEDPYGISWQLNLHGIGKYQSQSLLIPASPERVWEVLTEPSFIRIWDSVPDEYEGGALGKGSKLSWPGFAELHVSVCEEASFMRLDLKLPQVELEPSSYDVSYQYRLSPVTNHFSPEEEQCILQIRVGDFSSLPNAHSYQMETQKFLQRALPQISSLASM